MTYKFVIYGKEDCGFCDTSKDLLDKSGIEYEFKDVSEDEGLKEFVRTSWLAKGNPNPTVPLICTQSGEVIGGYSELCDYLIENY